MKAITFSRNSDIFLAVIVFDWKVSFKKWGIKIVNENLFCLWPQSLFNIFFLKIFFILQQFQSHRKVDRKLQRLSLYPLHPLMHENEKCSVVSDSLQLHRLVHGILLARILEWVAVPFSRGPSNSGIKPASPALQVDSSPAQPPGKPRTIGVGRPIPSPVDLPDPGIKPGFPALQADSLPTEPSMHGLPH